MHRNNYPYETAISLNKFNSNHILQKLNKKQVNYALFAESISQTKRVQIINKHQVVIDFNKGKILN